MAAIGADVVSPHGGALKTVRGPVDLYRAFHSWRKAAFFVRAQAPSPEIPRSDPDRGPLAILFLTTAHEPTVNPVRNKGVPHYLPG